MLCHIRVCNLIDGDVKRMFIEFSLSRGPVKIWVSFEEIAINSEWYQARTL